MRQNYIVRIHRGTCSMESRHRCADELGARAAAWRRALRLARVGDASAVYVTRGRNAYRDCNIVSAALETPPTEN